ncbi:MAG: hypothetical protein AB1422_08550 [bacterium]
MYCRLLQETIDKLKDEQIPDDTLPIMDLLCDTYIPEEYIKDTTQRYAIYKNIFNPRF